MSEPEDQRRANELSRLWQGQVFPVEDEGVLASQRARVVPSIGAAIERGAASRKKALRRRRLIAGFAVAAGIACTFGVGRLLLGEKPQTAAVAARASDVRALAGVVTLVNDNGPIAISRADIEVGDALSTAADAKAELRLTDLVLAEIGGASELSVVTPRASAHRVRLDRGHIRAKVDERPSPSPKLVVETPNVDVVVTGTIFQVDVQPGRSSAEFVTTVAVTKGRVIVRHGTEQLAAVGAGQSWTSGAVTTTPQRVEPAPSTAARAKTTTRRGAVAAARAVRPGTLAEENALFQGAVDARNGGDDRVEAERLGTLLNRFPGSPLAGAARVERMRALERTGQGVEAAREARRYLAENPDGYARDEARRLVMQGGMSSRPAP